MSKPRGEIERNKQRSTLSDIRLSSTILLRESIEAFKQLFVSQHEKRSQEAKVRQFKGNRLKETKSREALCQKSGCHKQH